MRRTFIQILKTNSSISDGRRLQNSDGHSGHRLQITIKTYFEYLPAGPLEAAWTFHVSAVGHSAILPGQPYPPARHPEDHAFTWERGRILSALQVVAICQGRGLIEWKTGRQQIEAGDVFLLLPGIWHRYRPDPQTGWTEDWIEMRGPTVEKWMLAALARNRPVGMKDEPLFWHWFEEIHKVCQEKKRGYRAVAAGLALTLLASLCGLDSEETHVPELVRRAMPLLSAGHEVQDVVKQLGISYPTLYRQFKEGTGISPKDYASQIRSARAEEFLAASALSVKEIAHRLRYHSASHFSLDFKRTHGLAPSVWKVRHLSKT